MKATGVFTGKAIRATVAALALIGVLSAGVPASAAATVPLKAGYLMTTYIGKDASFNVWDGSGTGTVVGASTCNAAVKITGKIADGVMTITASSGDSLIIAFTQTLDRVSETWVGTFTVTGGTGRFASASGGGVTIASNNPNGTVSNNFDGTLNF